MSVFLYLVVPMLIGFAVSYGLELLWPKQVDATESERDGRPAAKAASDSSIVDQPARLARESARKEERSAPAAVAVAATSAAVEPMEAFQLPSDFDMSEYQSHRE